MSPENDTPQHDDEATAELIIAKRLWARSNPGGWPEFGSVAITYADKARELVNELKEAGFEITKQPQTISDDFEPENLGSSWPPIATGISKGIPGLVDNLTRSIVDLEGSVMSEVLSERIKPGPFEPMAPSATQAAQTGMEIANRTVAYGSLGPDEALKMALDLIGRRTDIVAVKLPEPDRVNQRHNEQVWDVNGDGVVILDRFGVVRTYFEDIWDDDDHTPSSDDLRTAAAAMLSAAAKMDARADAANVADAAEDGGK